MTHPIWLHNLAAYALQVTLLVIVGALLPLAFRLRIPGARLAYWQTLLASCLLLPFVQPWTPAATGFSGAIPVSTTVVTIASKASGSSVIPTAGTILLILGAVAVLRLLWLACGLLRLRYFRRRALALDPMPAGVQSLQARMGVAARMYLSSDVAGPLTFGIRSPVILFPLSFLTMGTEHQEGIACHELLHVRRGDWLFTIAEAFVRSLLWFHPAIWWLLGQIQLAREQAVDRDVIEWTKARKHYLEALLAVATAGVRPGLALAPLFLRKRHLRQRVAALLKEVSMSKRRLAASLAGIFGLLLVTGWLATGNFPLRAAVQARPESAKPIHVGGKATRHKLIKMVKPAYPREAKLSAIQGKVRFNATIDKEGSIRGLEPLSGDPILIAAAEKAVRQWKYAPTFVDGTPVAVITQIDINFTLSK